MKPLYSQALLQDCREKEIVCSREKIRMELSAWCREKETNGFVYSSSIKISLIVPNVGLTEQDHQIRMIGLIVCCSLVPRLSMCTNKKCVLQATKSWVGPWERGQVCCTMLQTSSQHYLLHVHRVGIKYSSTLQAKFLFYCTEPDESQVWAHFTRCTATVQYNYTRKNRQYLTLAGRINSLMVMVAYPANFSPD